MIQSEHDQNNILHLNQKKIYKEIMQNYQSDEIQSLLEQRAKKISAEISHNMFLRLFLMLLPFLVYSISLHAQPDISNICKGQGFAWKCSNCRTYQWQDSSNKDWSGQYKCTSCGAKK